MLEIDTYTKIFVAGHRGMVGSAVCRALTKAGNTNIITRGRAELDLMRPAEVDRFFSEEAPEVVVAAAAKVGGILANNTYPAQFIYENLIIEANLISAAHRAGVKRLLFLGSSCIYPKDAPQPMTEDSLLTGVLEPTNEPYAIAKIAGIKLCESYNRQYGTDFRSVMPTNLYGPNDNYDLQNAHVLPAMIRKFHLAKTAAEGDSAALQTDEAVYGPIPPDIRDALSGTPHVRLWGTGAPRREFLYVDDLAEACLFVLSLPLETYRAHTEPMMSHLNVGVGRDITIFELADLVGEIVGFQGEVVWDQTKPDGTPRKLLNVDKLTRLGWRAAVPLREGIGAAYEAYRAGLAQPVDGSGGR
jgi:GDP-L-fucose synthase